jgi:hypothetical protein
VGGTCGDEELDALDPAYGAGDLAYEAVGDLGGLGEEAGVHVGGDGELGVVEGEGGEVASERSAARSTAAVAPEMTVWSGELRLAGETTARLGLKVRASGVVGRGVRSSVTWEQMVLMRSASRPRIAAIAPSPGGTACCM